MSGNFYEAELRKALHAAMESRRVRELGDSSSFFAELMKTYPASGSKIDWGRVPGSIERVEERLLLERPGTRPVGQLVVHPQRAAVEWARMLITSFELLALCTWMS